MRTVGITAESTIRMVHLSGAGAVSEDPAVWAEGLTCEVTLSISSNLNAPRVVCGGPAAARMRLACVHEHVRDVWVCDVHVSWAPMCRPCFGADGHLCEMRGIRLPVVNQEAMARSAAMVGRG